jgi:hypothetical protein
MPDLFKDIIPSIFMKEYHKKKTHPLKGKSPWNKDKIDVYSKETLEKLSKPKSEEHKQKLKVPRIHTRGPRGPNKKKRRPYSMETIKKMSLVRKKYWEDKRIKNGFI